jgi:hypothetical protein
METLLRNKEHIFRIKEKVENLDPSLFTHYCIENRQIDDETISIVMTSSNRSRQVLFTLKTIADSAVSNAQIIIVDDSDGDPMDIETLKNKTYPFNLDLIKIKRENKNWHNPLVNYNIGFKFIKGCQVIIQNAEVCHIGDVLAFVKNTVIEDDKYYVFDVKASLNYQTNNEIYNSDTSTIEIYNKNLFDIWYNHTIHRLCNYHFLSALNRSTFEKVKQFGYDCTMGSCYDDDEFLLKIISKEISIKNVINDQCKVGGLHLYHGNSPKTWDRGVELNDKLFLKKKFIYERFGVYCDATKNVEDFDRKYINLTNALF